MITTVGYTSEQNDSRAIRARQIEPIITVTRFPDTFNILSPKITSAHSTSASYNCSTLRATLGNLRSTLGSRSLFESNILCYFAQSTPKNLMWPEQYQRLTPSFLTTYILRCDHISENLAHAERSSVAISASGPFPFLATYILRCAGHIIFVDVLATLYT